MWVKLKKRKKKRERVDMGEEVGRGGEERGQQKKEENSD